MKLAGELADLRHQLHRHPEMSFGQRDAGIQFDTKWLSTNVTPRHPGLFGDAPGVGRRRVRGQVVVRYGGLLDQMRAGPVELAQSLVVDDFVRGCGRYAGGRPLGDL